jgi:hypothetical protein
MYLGVLKITMYYQQNCHVSLRFMKVTLKMNFIKLVNAVNVCVLLAHRSPLYIYFRIQCFTYWGNPCLVQ